MHESDLLKKKKKNLGVCSGISPAKIVFTEGGKNLTDLLQRVARTEAHYRNNSDTYWFLQD